MQHAQIIDGKTYNTKTSTLLAHNRYWDGRNWDRHGRNLFLYRHPDGEYFMFAMTMWSDERDHIEIISRGEALWFYDYLPEREVSREVAFPELSKMQFINIRDPIIWELVRNNADVLDTCEQTANEWMADGPGYAMSSLIPDGHEEATSDGEWDEHGFNYTIGPDHYLIRRRR